MGGNRKGDRRERELAHTLAETYGAAVMRAPASGSATERELPDVFFAVGGAAYAAEVKASSGDPVYFDGAKVDDLRWFATEFGATAYLVARFDYQTFKFFRVPEVHRTDGGNYRIKHETAEAHWRDLDGLLRPRYPRTAPDGADD